MNDSELFPELNLTVLKEKALAWATDKYPVIKKITLYRGTKPKPKFILIAEGPDTEDFRNPITFVFEPSFRLPLRIENLKLGDPRIDKSALVKYVKEAKLTEDEIQQLKLKLSELRSALRERAELNEWEEGLCLHLQEDLQDPGLYNEDNIARFTDEWSCWAKRPGEDLPDLIPPGSSSWVLFDFDAQAIEEHEEADHQIQGVGTEITEKQPSQPVKVNGSIAKTGAKAAPTICFYMGSDQLWHIGEKEKGVDKFDDIKGLSYIHFLLQFSNFRLGTCITV